jgi:hypothetical protein
MFQSIASVLEFVVLSLVPAVAVTAYWILARSPSQPETVESRQARLFGWFLWVGLVLISAVGMSATVIPARPATGSAGTSPAGGAWQTVAALLPMMGLLLAEGTIWLRRTVVGDTRANRPTVPPHAD